MDYKYQTRPAISASDAELIAIWFRTMDLEELTFGEIVALIPRAMKGVNDAKAP